MFTLTESAESAQNMTTCQFLIAVAIGAALAILIFGAMAIYDRYTYKKKKPTNKKAVKGHNKDD